MCVIVGIEEEGQRSKTSEQIHTHQFRAGDLSDFILVKKEKKNVIFCICTSM